MLPVVGLTLLKGDSAGFNIFPFRDVKHCTILSRAGLKLELSGLALVCPLLVDKAQMKEAGHEPFMVLTE